MLEALCRQSSTTLDIVHAEDGPPITQRTSGLVAIAMQFLLGGIADFYSTRFPTLLHDSALQ